MKKYVIILAAIFSGASYAVTSTTTGGASTTLTYAPTIMAGQNTNITSYSSNFRWIYKLYTFNVCQTGTYTASSTTTNVVNTTFLLRGTFSPSTTFPPPTPINNFFVSSFSGGFTAPFTNLSLTAGQQYSALVAFNQTTAGSYPYTNTLTFTGPGAVFFDGVGGCTPSTPTSIPTVNEWALAFLSLGLAAMAMIILRHRKMH